MHLTKHCFGPALDLGPPINLSQTPASVGTPPTAFMANLQML